MRIKKSKILKLFNFFVKIHDFSFYNSQYIFLLFWESDLQYFWSDHGVGDALPHNLNIFSGDVIIVFFKSYSKKLKKSHIFSHNFLHLFQHILRTTSSLLLIFLPHSLIHIPCIMVQLFSFSAIFSQDRKFMTDFFFLKLIFSFFV